MADQGSLTEAQEEYAKWLSASSAVASGQSYSIGGRSLSRTDSEEIRNWLSFWSDEIAKRGNANLNPSNQSGAIVSQFDILNER